MIKEEYIEIKVHSPKQYNLYNVKSGDVVSVSIFNLPVGSHVIITAVCDNCGAEKRSSYKNYIRMIKYDDKYYCVKCRDIKTSKSNLEKYGVKNVMQLESTKEKMYETNVKKYGNICSAQGDDIKEKSKKTCLSRYGFENSFQSDVIKEKKIQTCLSRYGFENVMQVPHIRDNQIKTMMKIYGVGNISELFKNKDIDKFISYSMIVRKFTKKRKKQLFEMWNGIDYYDGEEIRGNLNLPYTDINYPTIDHKISIYDGYRNGIPEIEISYIHNLCITKRSINSSKNKKSIEEFSKKNKINFNMRTKIICILDRSGSMASIINDAIGGFNTFLNEQKQVDGEATIDVLLFDNKFNKVVDNVDIQKVKELNRETYTAGGTTALYDAIGLSIDSELDFLSRNPKNRSDKTLVVILTDGEENASHQYSKSKIKLMITEMEEEFKWTFIFLAANQDAVLTADGIGISKGNSMNYAATSDGINVAYQSMSRASSHYRTTTNKSYDNIIIDTEITSK